MPTEQTEKTKVVCYCRVSTSSKDQYNSFENQQKYYRREIANNPEYELLNVYADKGISGTMLFMRPNFNKMLEDAGLEIDKLERIHKDTGVLYERYITIPVAKPKFKYIFTTNTSRFARNIEVVSILNDLRKNGVYVVFLEYGLSTEKESDIAIIQQKQIGDEDESRVKSGRVKRGMEESRQRDRLIINDSIYGYAYNKDDNALTVKEEEATVIREIFELYSQGLGTRRIAKHLADGNKVSRKGVQFSYSTIKSILKNIRYTGVDVHNKYNRSGVFSPQKYSKVRSFDEWIIKESDKVPEIISRELYDKCQAILASKKSHINNKGIYRGKGKFARLIYCESCKKPYNQTAANGRKFFICSTKKKKKPRAEECYNPNISYTKIEEAITSEYYFNDLLKYRLVYIKQLRELVPLLHGKLNSNNAAEIKRCQDEFAECERKRDIYVGLGEQGAYTADEVNARMKPVASDMVRLREKLDFYTKSNDMIANDIAEVHKTIAELTQFKIKEDKDGYTQDEIIKDIEKITISKNGSINIMFKTRYKMLALRDKHNDLWDALAEEQ